MNPTIVAEHYFTSEPAADRVRVTVCVMDLSNNHTVCGHAFQTATEYVDAVERANARVAAQLTYDNYLTTMLKEPGRGVKLRPAADVAARILAAHGSGELAPAPVVPLFIQALDPMGKQVAIALEADETPEMAVRRFSGSKP